MRHVHLTCVETPAHLSIDGSAAAYGWEAQIMKAGQGESGRSADCESAAPINSEPKKSSNINCARGRHATDRGFK